MVLFSIYIALNDSGAKQVYQIETDLFLVIFLEQTKLELFLAFFNLKLIDPIMIGTYEIFVCSFAIGASQTVSLDHSIRSSDLRNGDLSHCIATLSTPILRNFGYDTYDSAFKNLNDVYGVSSIDSEVSLSLIISFER